MHNSNDNNDDSITHRKTTLSRSEEIECHLGRIVESKRLFLHRQLCHQHDHLFNRAESLYESFSSSSQRTCSIESRDVSMLNHSELLSYAGTSWMAAVLIMANCTIGMGLLNFPFAILSSGGILQAMLTQLVIILFIIVSLTMMSHVSQYYGDVSFQGVIASHLGKYPKELCRVLIFINNLAALAVNLIVIGDQFENIGKAISGSDSYYWIMDRKCMVPLISIVFIFPLCFLKNFEFFKYTSFLGVLAAIYISVGLIFIRYFTLESNHYQPLRGVHPTNLVKIIPLICFTYECHIEIPPMVACLKKQTFWYYEKMIIGYVVLSSFIYSIAGIFGYWTFGEATPDDILMAYEPRDPLVIIGMILLTLKIVTTYPVVFYCLRIVVEDYCKITSIRLQNIPYFETAIKLLITIVLFFSTVLIAVFIPSITSVINLIGGISAVFIFIFPGWCYLKLYSQTTEKWNWPLIFLGAAYIVLGVFVTAMSTTQAIDEYINS